MAKNEKNTAKNDKNNTANEAAAKVTFKEAAQTISESDRQIAELMAKLEAARKAKSDAAVAVKNQFADALKEFCDSQGIADLDAFADLFKNYRKGLETGNATGGARSKVSEEERTKILECYRRAKAPDSTPEERKLANFSALAAKFGHPAQNVRNWAIKAQLFTPHARA